MNTFDHLKTMQREREKAQFDSSRTGKPLDIFDPSNVDRLPIDWRIEYEERAAILEYDGGLTREKADSQALIEIKHRMEGTVL